EEETSGSSASSSQNSPTPALTPSTLTVAIAGNPNTGKTTLLNTLVGANFSVGNWPGVTVEKKEGTAVFQNTTFHFVDLPGIYTLEPLSEDERVAANYLTTEMPDVILNVVETPNLARNLGLTLELAQFNTPMVVALNMADEARRAGLSVNLPALEDNLGVKALPTIGRTGAGVKELLPAILQAHAQNRPPKAIGQNTREERQRAADALYETIVLKREAQGGQLTQKLDAVLLHPVFGLLAYLGIMYLFFKISFDFSAPYMGWLDGFVNGFLAPLAQQALLAVNAPPILAQFMAEAVLGGFAFVLTFLPLIAVMFFLLTLLGMSGYMARLPFVLDRFMSRIGLNGKAIIPLLLGLGCNVPAIMATRALESTRDKMIVCLMIPFMSCPARLVVFSFFAVLFFPNPALVIMGLYVMGVVVAIGTSLFIKQRLFKNSPSLLVMELPPYRMPRLRTVGAIVWSHTREFLDRAGKVIFTVSVVVWLLIHVPFGAKPADSLVASAGKAITPIFAPIGLTDWRATTSLIPAFLAREVALSFMATIYAAEQEAAPPAQPMNVGAALQEQGVGLAEAVKNSVASLFSLGFSTLEATDNGNNALKDAVKSTFTPLSSLSFMILLLLYNSCLAVYSVMAKELGRKFANWFMIYSFIIGWGVAFVVYQGGKLLGGS
ncbi:MAG TPA: ferrous iron transport protein B, partial [Thermoflexales bacterium]|nr:ferrous iron transport protein B [Thermoflexales bacterium]